MKLPVASFFFPLLLCASLTACVLFYPRPGIVKTESPGGERGVRIAYPSRVNYDYDIAVRDDTMAVFFRIHDGIRTSFPPPYGLELDHRWFYYLALVDGGLNPLWKSPVRVDHAEGIGEKFSGRTIGVFATGRGFLPVYSRHNEFYFCEYGVSGERLTEKTKFYTSDWESGLHNKVLSVAFRDDCVYLFMLEKPANMYTGTWGINLIKRKLSEGKTVRHVDFIPSPGGWYHASGMSALVSGNDIHLAWIDGKEYDHRGGTYRLAYSFHYARCSIDDETCAGREILQAKSGEITRLKAGLIAGEAGVSVVLRDGDEAWHVRPGSGVPPAPVKSDGSGRDLPPPYHVIDPPFKVTAWPVGR